MPECDERLVQAVVDGSIEEIRKLLDLGIELNCLACEVYALGADCSDCSDCRNPGLEGATPLMLAIHGGKIDITQLLIEKGAEINAMRPLDGKTALDDAVIANRKDLVNLLVEAGAKVNNIDKSTLSYSALGYAIRNDNVEMVKHLIRHGANVNAPMGLHYWPLSYAAEISTTEIVSLLLDHGANPNHKNYAGQTPLMGAVRGRGASAKCRKNVVKLLLERGATNVNARRKGDSATALLMTSVRGCKKEECIEITKLLLEAGADPNVETRLNKKCLKSSTGGTWYIASGRSPLHMARKNGCEEQVRLLKAYGAKD
jgi:ankyrin repeat protein